ncbi:MAG TPA: radical SAM protein [Vicinamibacteria bacterium]|nr:radical SAM protein [Vicinamibacteria bacterium]
MSALQKIGNALGRILHQAPEAARMTVGADGPGGDLLVPSGGDGVWRVERVQNRHCLTPDEASHYVYFVVPPGLLAHAQGGLWLDVEYFGDRFAQFRVQYASTDRTAEVDGLYKSAQQRWDGDAVGLSRFRRALFPLPDFDPSRTQNQGASFRVEFRQDVRIARAEVTLRAPDDAGSFAQVAPLPELKKMPGRFYPINYLFIEITNACNFKCTWCPDDIMGRRRGFMKKEKAFRLLDEIAAKKPWLGPLYPVKLHQMGEPFLHPDLVEIVRRAEDLGVGVELNTNCGLITPENIDGLYAAGLTNLILSYQTPDPTSFKTRKAPRLAFDDYREKVRLAVERKVATGARTNLEIDIMNTKYADGYAIVSEDEQALAFLRDWISFAQELEARYGLPPRAHDWDAIRERHFLDQDENGSRYLLLPGVHLIWKRCHSWGNVIDTGHGADAPPPSTYCPAPYDQFVIQWNGDVTTCCTDYEGRTKTANVFAQSIESVWTGDLLKQRKRDMLEGRLLDVCAKCMGVPAAR